MQDLQSILCYKRILKGFPFFPSKQRRSSRVIFIRKRERVHPRYEWDAELSQVGRGQIWLSPITDQKEDADSSRQQLNHWHAGLIDSFVFPLDQVNPMRITEKMFMQHLAYSVALSQRLWYKITYMLYTTKDILFLKKLVCSLFEIIWCYAWADHMTWLNFHILRHVTPGTRVSRIIKLLDWKVGNSCECKGRC